jgi:hypothetical protein
MKPRAPEGYYTMSGYRPAGDARDPHRHAGTSGRHAARQDTRGGFEATADMLSITGMTLEQFADLMGGAGLQGRARRAAQGQGRGRPSAARAEGRRARSPAAKSPRAESGGKPRGKGGKPRQGRQGPQGRRVRAPIPPARKARQGRSRQSLRGSGRSQGQVLSEPRGRQRPTDRLDRWLWHARFFKTRSLPRGSSAAAACA